MNRINDLSIGQGLAVNEILALSGQIMTPRLACKSITEVMELYRQKMFRSEAISLNQLLSHSESAGGSE